MEAVFGGLAEFPLVHPVGVDEEEFFSMKEYLTDCWYKSLQPSGPRRLPNRREQRCGDQGEVSGIDAIGNDAIQIAAMPLD
eukprot:2610719-Alexandrium_andersonii.AAC.1